MLNTIGVFIDGENFSYNKFELYNNKLKNYNNIIVKRLYGDYSSIFYDSWRQNCLDYGLEQIHCPKISKKNSTDMKIMDDIYDFLYLKKSIDIFILISNDSDFITVCNKVKSMGKKFIVIGNDSCSNLLKLSCSEFIKVDNNQSINNDKNILNSSIINIDESNIKNNEIINNNSIMSEDNQDNKKVRKRKKKQKMENDESTKIIKKDNDKLLKYLKKIFENKRVYILNTLKQKIRKNYPLIFEETNISRLSDLESYIKKYLSNYFLVLENINNKSNKKVYFIGSYNSSEYLLLIDQIKSIFNYFNSNKLQSSVLKENLYKLTESFDNKDFGFQKFTDFIKTIYPNYFNIIRINTTDYVELLN